MLPDDRAGPSPPRRPRCNPPAQCDAPLARTSVRPASVDGSVSRLAGCSDGRGEQEAAQLLTGLTQAAHRRQTRTQEIADSLMGRIWNPDRGQFTGPVQLGEVG